MNLCCQGSGFKPSISFGYFKAVLNWGSPWFLSDTNLSPIILSQNLRYETWSDVCVTISPPSYFMAISCIIFPDCRKLHDDRTVINHMPGVGLLKWSFLWVKKCTSPLTHWGLRTYMSISNLTIIISDDGLLPVWHHTIARTNTRLLLIGP